MHSCTPNDIQQRRVDVNIAEFPREMLVSALGETQRMNNGLTTVPLP